MSVRTSVIDVIVDASAQGLDTFDAVGAGARGMAADLDSAASKAESAAGKFDGLGTSADDLDDKAGRATGALGALSAGFELIGAEGAAQGLQSAAMATDFLSGASQALTLVMDLEIAKKAASTAATVGQTVATKAQSAATKAAAAGQWALNAALTANPLAIVIALVVALAAGVVIAYKRSEEFRTKADAAMSAVKSAVDKVSNAVGDLVGWVRDKLPAGLSWVQTRAASIIKAAFDPIDTARNSIEGLRDFFRDKVSPAVDTMKAAVVPVLEKLATPIDAARSAVESLVSWIGKIDWPSPPKWFTSLGSKAADLVSGRTSMTADVTPSGFAPASFGSDTDVVGLLVAIRDLLAAASDSRSRTVDTSTLARLLADLLRREGIIGGRAAGRVVTA